MKILSIAVFGSSSGSMASAALGLAKQIGASIARRGHTLITGGCNGIPYEAVKGAMMHNGKSVAYSPWTTMELHASSGDPVEGFSKFVFVPENYEHANKIAVARKYRNISSCAACDACIIIAGQYGTLNEFTNAYDFLKPIGLLIGTGGFADLLADITQKLRKEPRPPIVQSHEPEALIDALENCFR